MRLPKSGQSDRRRRRRKTIRSCHRMNCKASEWINIVFVAIGRWCVYRYCIFICYSYRLSGPRRFAHPSIRHCKQTNRPPTTIEIKINFHLFMLNEVRNRNFEFDYDTSGNQKKKLAKLANVSRSVSKY